MGSNLGLYTEEHKEKAVIPSQQRWLPPQSGSHVAYSIIQCTRPSKESSDLREDTGAGIGDLLAQFAEEQISGEDFRRERSLPNGWLLNTKEELMYYRIFREHCGELDDLSWMGRTKGAPKQ